MWTGCFGAAARRYLTTMVAALQVPTLSTRHAAVPRKLSARRSVRVVVLPTVVPVSLARVSVTCV